MLVIPAVDLKGGKCVRLLHGKAENETVYSNDPVSMAKKWVEMGAKRLHVVDLDGAFTGSPQNLDIVLSIKKETNAFVQMGGGIRTLETMDRILGEGVDRIILGTIVFLDLELTQRAFEKYGSKIIVGLDAKEEMVAIKGWKDSTGVKLHDALTRIEKMGSEEIIFTDIGRDGTLEGVNLKAIINVMSRTKMKVYASGGVSSMRDIERLVGINSPGCIIGKAIYDNKIDLKEAFQLATA